MSKPYVTVLIDTYNHERFIENAIASVLDQDFPSAKMEILVVDDGSSDNTPKLVRKFEPRVRLIRKANGGQASAFNVGIAQAQGEVVAFLDGDDWWAPSKLREVVEAFMKNPGLGAVAHGYYEVNLETPSNVLVVPEKICGLAVNDVAGARSFLSASGFFATSCMAIRKKVLDLILPVPEELIFAADAFISFLAVAIAGATVLDRALTCYRVHSQNLWATKDPDRLLQRQKVQDCVAERVIARLSEFTIPREVLAVLAEPWNLDTERSQLSRDGGRRWRTFQAERAAYRLTYVDASVGYKLFKALVLGLTLLVPPRRFYQLRRWYTDRGFRRYREKLGNAVPAEPFPILRSSVDNSAIFISHDVNQDTEKISSLGRNEGGGE